MTLKFKMGLIFYLDLAILVHFIWHNKSLLMAKMN